MFRGCIIVLTVALAGCGPTPQPAGPRETVPRQCTVHGQPKSLEALVISLRCGTPCTPVRLSVRDVPVDVTLPRCAGTRPDLSRAVISSEVPATPLGSASIELAGPLALATERGEVWMTLRRDVTSRDGVVTARAGAQIVGACVKEDHVVASAILYSDSVEPGEDRPAPESVSALELPCDALALDPPGARAPASDATARYWAAADTVDRIALRAEPRGDAPAHDLSSTAVTIYVRELERRGAWLRVEARGEGVTATGWTMASQLVPVPAGTIVEHGYSDADASPPPPPVGELGGPATVRREGAVAAGTRVFVLAQSGLGTFTADTKVVVRDVAGAKLIQLAEVPGIEASPPAPALPLWVSRDAVRFAGP